MKKKLLTTLIALSIVATSILSSAQSALAAVDPVIETTRKNVAKKLFSANVKGGKLADPSGGDEKGVIIRQTPSSTGKTINFAPNGENVVLLKESGDYYYVSAGYGYYVGYIAKANLSDKMPSFLEGKAPLGTVNKDVALRDPNGIADARMMKKDYKPAADRIDSSKVKSFGTIKKGAEVEWLDYFGNDHFLVRVGEKIGFIDYEAFATTDLEFLLRVSDDAFAWANGGIYDDDGDTVAYIMLQNKTSLAVKSATLIILYYDKYGDRLDLTFTDENGKKQTKAGESLTEKNLPVFSDNYGMKDLIKVVPDEYYYLRCIVAYATFENDKTWYNPHFEAWEDFYYDSYYGK